MGNIIQSSAAAQGFYTCFKVPKIATGIIFSILTLILVLGGRKRVSKFSSYIVPILSVCYFVVSIAIIICNSDAIPSVFDEIVSDAFSIGSFGGGVIGTIFSKGAMLGASRGVLSNEAGCGTSTYAQDPNDDECAKAGAWGVFEVFVDTIVLCTLTALVILLVPNNLSDAMGAVIYSYSYYGVWGGYFVAISSWFFALASVVCWSYYGTNAISYLTNKNTARVLYLLLYSAAGVMGSVFAPSLVWEISDITVSVMAIFNTICVCRLWRSVKTETDLYFR
jgi:AGCS family alanine or glycine:cation symporter